jgi:hypothetical protein
MEMARVNVLRANIVEVVCSQKAVYNLNPGVQNCRDFVPHPKSRGKIYLGQFIRLFIGVFIKSLAFSA